MFARVYVRGTSSGDKPTFDSSIGLAGRRGGGDDGRNADFERCPLSFPRLPSSLTVNAGSANRRKNGVAGERSLGRGGKEKKKEKKRGFGSSGLRVTGIHTSHIYIPHTVLVWGHIPLPRLPPSTPHFQVDSAFYFTSLFHSVPARRSPRRDFFSFFRRSPRA